jgi:hypothetical protein
VNKQETHPASSRGLQRSSKMKEGTANCVDILIAIILPPLGVFLKFGCKVYVHCFSN